MINGPAGTVKLARKLRSEMSLPERLLWRVLKERPGGFKFRRQHPAGIYVLDFYCAGVKLAIEIDGISHDGAEAAQRQEARSSFLRSQHVATLRVPAKAVLNEIEAVVRRIVDVCQDRAEKIATRRAILTPDVPHHHASHGPPPPAGEAR